MKIGNTLLAATGAVLIGTVGIANAQKTAPATQGLQSVDKNLVKDPDNRGLENAQDRITANQKRFAAHKAELADRKADRLDRPAHPDRR